MRRRPELDSPEPAEGLRLSEVPAGRARDLQRGKSRRVECGEGEVEVEVEVEVEKG